MSDHTTLTDTERATLAAWWESDWPSDGADVLDTLAAVVESIVAARVAVARAERDRAWIGAVTLLLRAVTTNDATFDVVLPDMLAAARAEERAKAAATIEGFRGQNPMNGDASNYTIDRMLTALVGPDELARLKREHQDRWNAEYLAFRARVEEVDHG